MFIPSPTQLVSALLLLSAAVPTADAAFAHRAPTNRRRHHARREGGELVQRHHLPITTTTTVTLDVTSTSTCWTYVTASPASSTSSSSPPLGEQSSSLFATLTSSAASDIPSSSVSATGSVEPSGGSPSVTESPSSTSGIDGPSSSVIGGSASVTASSSDSTVPTASSSASSRGQTSETESVTTSSSSLSSASPSDSSSPSASTSSGGLATSASQSTSTGVPDPTSTGTVSDPFATSSSSSTWTSDSVYVTSSAASSLTPTTSESDSVSSSTLPTASSTSVSVTESLSASSTIVTVSSTVIESITSTSSSSTTSSSSSPAATTTAATGGSGRTTTPLKERLVAAYYPDWSTNVLSPQQIDFTRYDVVDFAFAIPTADFNIVFTQWDSLSTLTNVVNYAHASGKLARLSIGGWTGSTYFSLAVATEQNRQTFANNILTVYNQYNLDGIDIDWEYPALQGSGTNYVSPDDSANLLLFFQTLRKTLPPTAVISAATQVWPFAGPNGWPMTDVSEFAKVLDWVLVMNYDVWGASSTPGPNAPLSDGCGTSSQPLANAYAAVSSWTTAGMPANQIMLGVPAYGYLQISSANSLRTRDSVTLRNAVGGTADGQIQYRSLVEQGALALDGSGRYVGAGGFTRQWDWCSSTPWLKSTSSGQIVTYDDPESLSLKGQFARQAGLRGTNMWDMAGDTVSWALTDALRTGMGL